MTGSELSRARVACIVALVRYPERTHFSASFKAIFLGDDVTT